MKNPSPKPKKMANGAVSDAAKMIKPGKMVNPPKKSLPVLKKGTKVEKKTLPLKKAAPAPKKMPRRQPGEMTPAMKRWLNSLSPAEKRVAMVQFKNEKNAGKLSKGTK